MLFNSFHFAIFFPVVLIVYFSMAHRYRWILLLAASYYFYMAWKPAYLILIVLSTAVDYWAGIQMGRTTVQAKRRKYLLFSLLINLSLLGFFKYFNFFNDSLRALFSFIQLPVEIPYSNFLLPVGISFYTFQTLSYSIEVYRGKQKPETHFGYFAVYVSFFPQLVAGPIERPSNLLPQFRQEIHFDYNRVTSGLRLMTWGFFQKLVIADNAAYFVDRIYNNPSDSSGLSVLAATVLFAFQIYCDFSGYSDIAIGSARIMGIDLMKNFNRPYFACSVGEFWKRWHISLSTWFKDYVYIPLGGNRVSIPFWCLNILIVFTVSGLWHGANWTFVIWGFLHGIYLLMGRLTQPWRDRWAAVIHLDRWPVARQALQIAITFVLVNIGWIFFRADNLEDANIIFSRLLSGWTPGTWGANWEGIINLVTPQWDKFAVVAGAIVFLLSVHAAQSRVDIHRRFVQMPFAVRWASYYAILISIVLFGNFGQSPFLYFQF